MQELPTEKLGPRGAVGPEMNCKPRHEGEDEVGEEEGNRRSLMFGFPRAYILGAEAHKSYHRRGNLHSVSDLETENIPVNSELCETYP